MNMINQQHPSFFFLLSVAGGLFSLMLASGFLGPSTGFFSSGFLSVGFTNLAYCWGVEIVYCFFSSGTVLTF